jgi:TfoX/Sxy family transcriptional regulator of competence genes
MPDRSSLVLALRTACSTLPNISEKKMFGCEAFFAGERLFALVSNEGRIALKLPDPARYAALAARRGAAPWSPGGRTTMGAWLLVPAELEKPRTLLPWLQEAHAMAAVSAATTKKKTAKKKSVPKKRPS